MQFSPKFSSFGSCKTESMCPFNKPSKFILAILSVLSMIYAWVGYMLHPDFIAKSVTNVILITWTAFLLVLVSIQIIITRCSKFRMKYSRNTSNTVMAGVLIVALFWFISNIFFPALGWDIILSFGTSTLNIFLFEIISVFNYGSVIWIQHVHSPSRRCSQKWWFIVAKFIFIVGTNISTIIGLYTFEDHFFTTILPGFTLFMNVTLIWIIIENRKGLLKIQTLFHMDIYSTQLRALTQNSSKSISPEMVYDHDINLDFICFDVYNQT